MQAFRYLKYAQSLQQQFARNYAFKSDLKIKWVRPEKISCIKPERSGDASGLPSVAPQELLPEFRISKELESADPLVKSLFQLENNRSTFTSRHHREQMVKEVQRHPLDYGSMEAKLAKMTATIRHFQQHMEAKPRDVAIKVKLKEMIEKRKKFLKYLRRWDYRRFEWILEKLDLVYKPPPTEFHWVTRKESLRKLTNIYCEDIKQQRLQEYRQKLEAQQIPFLEDAIQKLNWARDEQQKMGLAVTITEEQIEAMKIQLEDLRQKAVSVKAKHDEEESTHY